MFSSASSILEDVARKRGSIEIKNRESSRIQIPFRLPAATIKIKLTSEKTLPYSVCCKSQQSTVSSGPLSTR